MSTPADQLRFVPDAPAAPTAGLSFVPDAPAESERPAPTQPAAPAWRPSDPLGAALHEVTGPIAEGIAGTVAGNARGVYDVLTGRGLDQASRDVRETEQRYQEQYRPRTAVGEAANEATQAVAGKIGQARDYVGDVLTRGDPQEVAKEKFLEEWRQGKHPDVTQDQLRAAGMMPRGESINNVNPEGAALVRQGAGALTGMAAGEALGATANAAGRVIRRAPYAVEAESTAPRGPTTVEGDATPINRRPGLPDPNAPAGGAGRPLPGGGTGGGGEGAGGPRAAGGAPQSLGQDPSLVPALRPGYEPPARGRRRAPVTIEGEVTPVADGGAGGGAKEPPRTASGLPEGAMFEPSRVPGSEVPLDREPGPRGEVTTPEQEARMAIARRMGLKTMRRSAIEGDGISARTDLNAGETGSAVARLAQEQFQHEKTSLRDSIRRAIRRVGASDVEDEPGGGRVVTQSLLRKRGVNTDRFVREYEKWFDKRRKREYKRADKVSGGAPITNLTELDDPATGGGLLNDGAFSNTMGARGQRHVIDSARAELARLRKDNPNGFNEGTLERFRQFLNDAWTPDTAWAIARIKGVIDGEVMKVAGTSQYKNARRIVQVKHELLDDPKSIARLFDVDPRNPLNRRTPYVDLMDRIWDLEPENFDNLVGLLEQAPKALRKSADRALAEIRGHALSRMLDEGMPAAPEGIWNGVRVDQFVADNDANLERLFARDAQTTQDIRDVMALGRINRANPKYPGADPQSAALRNSGLLAGGVMTASTMAGGALGHLVGGVVGAPEMGAGGGMAIGAGAARPLADVAANARAGKVWGKRVVDLSKGQDKAPPSAGPSPDGEPPKPKRKPPAKKPAAAAASQPAAGGPAATPAPPPNTLEGLQQRGPGGEVLPMPPQPAPPLTPEQAIALARRRGLTAQADAAEAGLRAGGPAAAEAHQQLLQAMGFRAPVSGATPPTPPNTLASTETPPAAPAAPASAPPTLASTEGAPAPAPKAAPVATGPTLASVSEGAPPPAAPAPAVTPPAPGQRPAEAFGEPERATAIKRIGELVEQKRTAGTDSLQGAKSAADNVQENIDNIIAYLKANGVSKAEIDAAVMPFSNEASGLMQALKTASGGSIKGASAGDAALIRADDARQGELNAKGWGKDPEKLGTGPPAGSGTAMWKAYEAGNDRLSKLLPDPNPLLVKAREAGIKTKAEFMAFLKAHGFVDNDAKKGIQNALSMLPPLKSPPTPLNTTPPPKLPGRE